MDRCHRTTRSRADEQGCTGLTVTGIGSGLAGGSLGVMSKRTQRKKAKARRSKANHGRKPNLGRNS